MLAACTGEASLPIAAPYLSSAGLYNGHIASPYYAGGYNDARFAYGVPITAVNARLTPGPVVDAPVVSAPYVAAAAPLAAVAPIAAAAPISGPVSSQYQAQDEFGNIAYGYSNINSAKQETGEMS